MGPWLVALGAALWGIEAAWRVPLSKALSAEVIVFWEQVIQVVILAPFLWIHWKRVAAMSSRAWLSILVSGVAGSAVGTIFLTKAFATGNPTVVNVILNLQPLLSTFVAWLLFRDTLSPWIFPLSLVAVACGAVLSVEDPTAILSGVWATSFQAGTGWALLTAFFWGIATVAGRGVTVEIPVGLAAILRVLVGLLTMTIILSVNGALDGANLWPEAAQATPGPVIRDLLLLTTITGALPLFIYFRGLSMTIASTAGYFEMMQTLASIIVTWGVFGAALTVPQTVAAAVLVATVALIQHVQATSTDKFRPAPESR
jgi:drug/metabolite transporter (DMT)-like permease